MTNIVKKPEKKEKELQINIIFLFFEVSAKEGTNGDECFNTLIQRIYERDHQIENDPKILTENKIKLTNNKEGKKVCLK